MSTFVLGGADPTVLLHHLAFYGLADILDTAGTDVTLTWQDDRPVLSGEGLDRDAVDAAVRAHVDGRRVWTFQTSGPKKRGTMSPRLTAFDTAADWEQHESQREHVLDELTARRAWPDLRYLASLGEPSYWNHRDGKPSQDDAASRWEMQPRQQGSEFVSQRLRKLTDKLRKRKPGQFADALAGHIVIDELDSAPDSVSATGLATPGPVDSVVLWCALWGIGQFPLAYRVRREAVTSGHIGRGRREWFYVPVWTGMWRPARLRLILASAQLRTFAASGLASLSEGAGAEKAAASWLNSRRVVGALRFPIQWVSSGYAVERRALRAEAIPL